MITLGYQLLIDFIYLFIRSHIATHLVLVTVFQAPPSFQI